jgi:four helix bundle protein
MAKVEKFEDLNIWKEAVKIGVEIYKISSKGVLAKDYSAKDQIRRAAVSISNNIAEGFEYNNNLSFIRFLRYSKGSAGELRSNLLVLTEAEMVEAVDYEKIRDRLVMLSKAIESFIKYLRNFENKKNGQAKMVR